MVRRKVDGCTVLIITWAGGGNVRAILDTAADLVGRNNIVHVLSNPTLRPQFEAVGATFHAYRRIPPHDPGSPATDIVRAYEGETAGECNRIIADRLVFGPAERICADGADVAELVRPDVMLIDYVLPGAMIAAELRGTPYVIVSDAQYPLPYAERESSLSTYAYLFERMVMRRLPAFNRLRTSFSLAPLEAARDLYSGAAKFVVVTYGALGGPKLPSSATFVGPQFAPPVLLESELMDRRRLPAPVVGSFGTTYNAEQSAFVIRLAEALGRLNVDAKIGVGATATERTATLRGVEISSFIPLEKLLRRARLIVNHGGNATMVRAAAMGVPQLCIPFANDQHESARRVLDSGVGLVLNKNADVNAIEDAIKQLLDDDRFLRRAEELRQRICREHEDAVLARILEAIGCNHTRLTSGQLVR